MKWLVEFAGRHLVLSWLLAALIALGAGYLSSEVAAGIREHERLDHLETDAERRSLEMMSQTLNGNLMGSVAMLGLIDLQIKSEALGQRSANSEAVLAVLESIGRSYDADGVFVVAQNGVITSSWDNAGKPSTGLNVKFRPYYQMAMQGMDNVYAAVSLARGDRALYFSAPIYRENTSGTEAIGALVARTGLLKVDELLRDKSDIALLLSPQGVVFSSNRSQWIGHLAGAPTAERLAAIRQLKQFGNLFEGKAAQVLPFAVENGITDIDDHRYAVAVAKVKWNDPFGDWQLVLMEDLERSVPSIIWTGVGGAVFLIALLILMLLLKMLQSHYRQIEVGRKLEDFARGQQESTEYKTGMAVAGLIMQQAGDVKTLADEFLAESHRLYGSLQGVVYVNRRDVDGLPVLELAGSYACAIPPPGTLRHGEGLLGQVAIERQYRMICMAEDSFMAIRSGLGETRPGAVLIAPIVLGDDLLGVVEIGLLAPPSEEIRGRFEEFVGLLAMNLEIVGRSTANVVSAVQEAERQQAERLAFQQALVDTIPYPVFYKGPDTRFMGFNRAYEEAFRVRREDLIGKRVLDLTYLPEADRQAYQAEDERTIAAVGSIRREMQIPFADGQLHRTLYYVSGFRRPDGAPGGLVGTFIDLGVMTQEPA